LGRIAFGIGASVIIQQPPSAAGKGRRLRQAVLAAISAVVLASCNSSKNAYIAPPPPKVVVAQPLQQPVTLYFELTGNTQAINSVDLVARVQGYLESIDYKDGSFVTKGTQLFGIERDTYQQQLDQAQASLAANEATLEYNKAEYQRQSTLARQDFASQSIAQQWRANQDSAAAQVLSAKAAIELAKINLGYTNVLAPFDGVVTNHLVDIGALVGAGSATKLATIVQMDPLYVYFTLSESQVLTIKENNAKAGLPFRTTDLGGIPVETGLQGEEGYPHKGHMDYASPVGHLDKAMLTRNDAIGTSQEGPYVLVVGPDNVVQRKVVKTGDRQGQLRIIDSGLDPSDWVVTEGIQRAFPGAKVEPQRTELTANAADSSSAAGKPAAQNPAAQ